MMIQSVLLILPILSTTFAATFPTPVNIKIQYATKHRSPEERRKLGLFPKTSKKFVITEKPPESNEAPYSNEENDKRPQMPRLKINNNGIQTTQYYIYKKPVTRRPLMKYKKFIVNPTSSKTFTYITVKNSKEVSYEESVEEINAENEQHYLKENDDNSSEAENFKSDENIEEAQESVEEDNYTTELALTDVAEMENNRLKRDNTTSSEIIMYPDPSGENQDLEEFIFVKNIEPRSVSEQEFTTDSTRSHTVNKRAVNVIEEENLGTTISVLKFTGRETYLTNELNYKNIHS